jgi:hypothetical protein
VLRGDTYAVVADFSQELRSRAPELASALPQPVTAASFLSVDVGDQESVALIRYSGDDRGRDDPVPLARRARAPRDRSRRARSVRTWATDPADSQRQPEEGASSWGWGQPKRCASPLEVDRRAVRRVRGDEARRDAPRMPLPIFPTSTEWARVVSNHRPLACEAAAPKAPDVPFYRRKQHCD